MGIITVHEEHQEMSDKLKNESKPLLDKIKDHFLYKKESILKNIRKRVQESPEFKRKREETNEEKFIVECGLMQIFENELPNWPSVPSNKFYDMVFNTCKINFENKKGRIVIDNLIPYLSDGSGECINIKLLRDCILGRESQNLSQVWLWGLKDERVGAAVSVDKKKNTKEVTADSLEAYEVYQEPFEF